MKYYTPILRLKTGEINAVEKLKPETKKILKPLFYFDEIPNDNILEKLPEFFFYDTLGNDNIVKQFKEKINEKNGIPVIYLSSLTSNIDSIDNDKEICIRLTLEDFDNINIFYQLKNFENKNLIIDFQNINTIPNVILNLLINNIKPILEKKWNYISIAGTTIPDSMSNIDIGESFIERKEWTLLYKNFVEEFDFINYSDYTIVNPTSITDTTFDPKMMSPAAKIRYTLEDNFFIVKGKSFRKYGGDQYEELSKKIINSNYYKGENFSYGDSLIKDASIKKIKGNLTTWVTIDINHHIELVASLLSN